MCSPAWTTHRTLRRCSRPRWLRLLEEAATQTGAVAVAAYETQVRQGDSATEILAEAAAEDADLIVIGYCRGMSLGAAAAPNGVAARVLRRAQCAVLTVPI